MGKYKGFKNGIERYFSTEDGQRVLNFAYSFGAAIVIIGALFKIIHIEGADIILCIGMGVEALIFALSAFDKPATNYHWEEVFPVLTSQNPNDRPDFANMPKSNAVHTQGAQSAMPLNAAPSNGNYTAAQVNFSFAGSDEAENATRQYVSQVAEMTAQLQRLKEITSSLTEAQSVLLNSYNTISDNSEGLSNHSTNYIQQMDALNRNITGLNTIYEIQLKSVSSQLDTIDKVNSGLSNIRTMYENSTMDSFKIRQETEKMTDNLSQLNKVYERMLSAMTMSMQNPGIGR